MKLFPFVVMLFLGFSSPVLAKTSLIQPVQASRATAEERTIVLEAFLFRLLMTTLPARIIKFLPLLLTPPLIKAAMAVEKPSFNLYQAPPYSPPVYSLPSANSPPNYTPQSQPPVHFY